MSGVAVPTVCKSLLSKKYCGTLKGNDHNSLTLHQPIGLQQFEQDFFQFEQLNKQFYALRHYVIPHIHASKIAQAFK